MADPFDVLLNDRPFVEFVVTIVPVGPDHFTPVIGLMIRPRALKPGRKEWWMLSIAGQPPANSGDSTCI